MLFRVVFVANGGNSHLWARSPFPGRSLWLNFFSCVRMRKEAQVDLERRRFALPTRRRAEEKDIPSSCISPLPLPLPSYLTLAGARASMESETRAGGTEEEYCVCRQPATAPETMLTCMDCQRWFHINCVLPKDSDITLLAKYYCQECQSNKGRQIKWLKGTGKGKKKRKQDDAAHITESTSHNASTENSDNKEDNVPKRAREEAIETTSVSSPPNKQEPLRRSLRSRVKHNYSELNDGAEQGVITDKSIVVDYVKMLRKARCVKSEDIPLKVKGEELTVAFLSESGFREPMIVDDLEALDMKMPPNTITVNRIKELVGMLLLLHCLL
jgi:hypothetical protein